MRDHAMELLKLIALDNDDLKVFSAHLQDAVIRTEDIAFLPKERRFAIVMNRFDWLGAVDGAPADGYARLQCALRFEKVRHVQYKHLAIGERSEIVELLAVRFHAAEPPSGAILLTFAGGPAIKLHVDCIEAELRDLGPIWRTPHKPRHPDDLDEIKPAS
jgi:hypothetical protein